MEMIQFLEADKEQLYGSITQAGTPEQVEGVIEKELDRLLLRYNEECKEERVRDTARYMLQTAKTMSPMISAAGETRVWERSTSGATGGETKWSKTAIISLAGGVLFLAGALLGLAVAAGSGLSFTSLLGSIPAAILGGALLFWSGRLSLIRNAESGGGAGKGGAGERRAGEEFLLHFLILFCYLVREPRLKIGRNMAVTIVPMTMPRNTMRNGSISEVSVASIISTSSS